MKKGFTLAEILITLAIIGVIAAITLPALINNINEIRYLTAFKKVVNTLTEVEEMTLAQDGFGYGDILSSKDINKIDSIYNSDGSLKQSFHAMIMSKTQGTTVEDLSTSTMRQKGTYTLADGIVLYVSTFTPAGYAEVGITVDVNGKKGPNKISDCGNNGDGNPAKAKDCEDKSKQNIRDRFSFYIRKNSGTSYFTGQNDFTHWYFGTYK